MDLMKIKALIYMIAAGVLWGTSGIFVHYLTPLGFTSLQMTTARAAVSFVCIALVMMIKNWRGFAVKPTALLRYFALGACLYLTAVCYYTSMQLTSVSVAVVLMYTAPIYVMLFSVTVLKERFSLFKLISVGVMLIGCALVSGIVGTAKFNAEGILIGLGAGVAYAAYTVIAKISVSDRGEPLSITTYAFLFMLIISSCVASPITVVNIASANFAVAIPLLIGLGVVTFVLPYFLYNLSMRSLSAGTASALGIIEPMSATLFSVVLLAEKLDVYSTVGIILILITVVLLSREEITDRIE